RWVEYSKAKDLMIEHTDIPEARWRQVEGDDKRRARLNVIQDILNAIEYEDIIPGPINLGPRPQRDKHYKRPPRDHHYIVEKSEDKSS
ncbi:MAG: polyphosphate kinase 2, partial [Chloroflexota bacterium]